MDNKNLAGKELFKKRSQSIAINKTTSLFDTNVAIHMNKEEPKDFVFEPVEIKRTNTYRPNEMPLFETLKSNIQEEKNENNQEIEIQENEQEIQKEEQLQKLQTEIPLNLVEQKEELQKDDILETNKPGEALERYIIEVETKKTIEKNKSASLESALAYAKECKRALNDKELVLHDKVKLMNLALKEIDKYIKETKGFGRKNGNLEQDAEQRDLREASKMLRVQLFLEKMELVESENSAVEKTEEVDETQLYKQQLEADARIKLYSGFQNKNIEENEIFQKQEASEVDIQQRKKQQLIAENNREIQRYAAKIEESEKKAKELQEKMGAEGYEIRHKQFLRNSLYQQKVEEEVARIRPLIIKEWLDDNQQQIIQNAKKLLEIVSKDKVKNQVVRKNKQVIIRMSELASFLKTDISDDEKLAIAAAQYKHYFDSIAMLTKYTSMFIDAELKDMISAQLVLFEKRELLIKEWNESEAKSETEKQTTEKNEETNKQEQNKKEQNKKEQVLINPVVELKPLMMEKQDYQPSAYTGMVSVEQANAVAVWERLARGEKVIFAEAHKMAFVFSKMNDGELQKIGINSNMTEALKRFSQASFITKYQKENKNYKALSDGSENEQLVSVSETQEMGLERITSLNINTPKKIFALDDGDETAYAERFLKRLVPNYSGPVVEEYSYEEGKAEYERQQAAVVKYQAIYDYMTTKKEEMGKLASGQFETMMNFFQQYTKALEKGPIKEHVYTDLKKALESYISTIKVKSPMIQQGTGMLAKLSNMDMEKAYEAVKYHWKLYGPIKATHTLLIADERKVKQEQLERERREQAEQSQREQEEQELRRKQEDLEFQKVNNEYALQGMASEEKEKEEKKEKIALNENRHSNTEEANEMSQSNNTLPQQEIVTSNKDLFREGSGVMIKGFEAKYQEIKDMIFLYDADKADTSYIDQVRDEFLKQFHHFEEDYYAKEQASTEEEIGVLLTRMSEYYSQKILELQPVYDWLYERKLIK